MGNIFRKQSATTAAASDEASATRDQQQPSSIAVVEPGINVANSATAGGVQEQTSESTSVTVFRTPAKRYIAADDDDEDNATTTTKEPIKGLIVRTQHQHTAAAGEAPQSSQTFRPVDVVDDKIVNSSFASTTGGIAGCTAATESIGAVASTLKDGANAAFISSEHSIDAMKTWVNEKANDATVMLSTTKQAVEENAIRIANSAKEAMIKAADDAKALAEKCAESANKATKGINEAVEGVRPFMASAMEEVEETKEKAISLAKQAVEKVKAEEEVWSNWASEKLGSGVSGATEVGNDIESSVLTGASAAKEAAMSTQSQLSSGAVAGMDNITAMSNDGKQDLIQAEDAANLSQVQSIIVETEQQPPQSDVKGQLMEMTTRDEGRLGEGLLSATSDNSQQPPLPPLHVLADTDDDDTVETHHSPVDKAESSLVEQRAQLTTNRHD